MRSTARRDEDLTTTARIRDAAITYFGEHGFRKTTIRAIAAKAEVSPALVIHHFGSKDGLRTACDDYITESIRESKSESLQTHDPAAWFSAIAEIEEFAPMMAYLVRSMQAGGDLAKTLWRRMIDNAGQYIAEGVRAGTVKPSPDPKARAFYLAITGGGGFLLYLQLHDSSDLHTVLPALEVYSNGLLTDSTMYDAFLAQHDKGIPLATAPEENTDDDHSR